MCAAMVGADPDALDRLAGLFNQQAQALDTTAQRVRAQVHASPWRGGAANRFRADWDSTHMPRLRQTSSALRNSAKILRQQAADQRNASGVSGGSSAFHSIARGGGGGGIWKPSFAGIVEFGTNAVVTGSEVFGHAADAWKAATGFELNSYASSVLKGVGLGAAVADLATAVKDSDVSGAMVAIADGGFGLVSKFGPGAIYSGLKAEIGFFIPLTANVQDEHFAWMAAQGHSPQHVSERYEGFQGFINLGNDNVERKAPWMNDVADVVMQKPAEWLYKVGIRF